MKVIKLPYSPAITQEKVMEILHKEYPGKKISKYFNLVKIKENPLRFAHISVLHVEKKNLTQITIAAALPNWTVIAMIIPIIYIALGLYSICGNWATDVTGTLASTLRKA